MNAQDQKPESLLNPVLKGEYPAGKKHKPAPWHFEQRGDVSVLVYDNSTPGPWTAQLHTFNRGPQQYQKWLVVSEVGEHPTPICELDISTEAQANAMLIVQAPAILAQCGILQDALQSALIALDNPTSDGCRKNAIAIVRKALGLPQ